MQVIPSWITSAVLFGSLLVSAAAQSTPAPASPSSEERTAQVERASGPDIKDDIQKMRMILNQMRNNLAFVGSTTTPLAHQFQLDIDMWQALLDHMEKKDGEKPR